MQHLEGNVCNNEKLNLRATFYCNASGRKSFIPSNHPSQLDIFAVPQPLAKYLYKSQRLKTQAGIPYCVISVAVKDGAPEKDDLEGLAKDIVAEWKELGRRLLDNNEAELYAIDEEIKRLPEKAYKMLLKWKESKGSGATFQVLHDALCHELVNRRDLAEKYCLINHHY